MVEIDRHKASLIGELEVSRSEVRNALARCEESLDVVSQLRRNVQENKVAWAAGAGILGFVASRILLHGLERGAKGNRAESREGIVAQTGENRIVNIAAFLFDLAKPTLLAWVGARLSTLLSGVTPASTSASAGKPQTRKDQPPN
jgi:hypothetical protein